MNRLPARDRLTARLLAVATPALVALLAACTSADKCRRGEEGCACRQTNRPCNTGLICDSTDMCVEGKDEPDAGPEPEPDAGTPDVACSNNTLEGACQDFCEAFCQNQERLCVVSACLPGDCDPGGDLLGVCLENCSGASCARMLCVAERERTCSEFGFIDPDTDVFMPGCFESDPQCVLDPSYGCSDTCGDLDNGTGGERVNNGRCEDSGEGSVAAVCPRGTDCTDCGERTCQGVGMPCDNHGDCCDFFEDGALCVEVTADQALCLATCDEDNPCPAGAECRSVDAAGNSVCAPN